MTFSMQTVHCGNSVVKMQLPKWLQRKKPAFLFWNSRRKSSCFWEYNSRNIYLKFQGLLLQNVIVFLSVLQWNLHRLNLQEIIIKPNIVNTKYHWHWHPNSTGIQCFLSNPFDSFFGLTILIRLSKTNPDLRICLILLKLLCW